MEAVVAALISGGLALLGTIITVRASTKRTEQTLRTELAVMNNEVKNLRKEVEKHNGFAERIPKVETAVEGLSKDVQTLQSFHLHA